MEKTEKANSPVIETVEPEQVKEIPVAVAATETVNKDNSEVIAIVSIVIAVLNLCSWFIPIFGCPMAIAGLICGYFGLKSPKYKTYVIIAMVVSGLALLATIANSVAGMLLNMKS